MAWSTPQLAELAGTTLTAVLHYHEAGLLEEPDRLPNGDKQYGVPHLLRVLQITRLAELGVPLAEVASTWRAGQNPDEALRALDADLAASIDRLERVRAHLPVMLQHRAQVELPVALGAAVEDRSAVDRTMLQLYARVLDDSWMDHLRPTLDEQSTDADDTFGQMGPDADEPTRQRVAEAIAASTRGQLRDHVLVSDVQERVSRRTELGDSAILAALRELYNPAQIDVLLRAYTISQGEPQRQDEP